MTNVPAPNASALSSKGAQSCASTWAQINKDVQGVASISDPLERNRKITASYAQLYQNAPELKWAGLAAFVSRQAGCNMVKAKGLADSGNNAADRQDQWLADNPASDGGLAQPFERAYAYAPGIAYQALGDTNQLIYKTVFPAMKLVQTKGAKGAQKCISSGDIQVPPRVKQAVDQLAAGQNDAAALTLAKYEQVEVVDKQIYKDPKTEGVFGLNQMLSYVPGSSLLGVTRPQIALSPNCGDRTAIPMSGWITNSDDRVSYYEQLENAMGQQPSSQLANDMSQMIEQGR